MLPAFNEEWIGTRRVKPRIQILEIRDRNTPKGNVIALLAIERQETYRHDPRDGTLHEASISITYFQITADKYRHATGKGRFDGSYSKTFNSVSLTSPSTSKGAVFLDPPELRNQHIGTYLMNEIVQWAKQWPDANVQSIELLSGQAKLADEKECRNKFYERFGLIFDYKDSEHREGRSRRMQVRELKSQNSWELNISEHRICDYLSETLAAKDRAEFNLAQKVNAYNYVNEEIRLATAKPILWAVKTLYYKHSSSWFFLLLCTVFGLWYWWSYLISAI